MSNCCLNDHFISAILYFFHEWVMMSVLSSTNTISWFFFLFFSFYCDSSLKQQYIALLGQNIQMTSKLIFALTPSWCMHSRESTNTNFSLWLTRPGFALKASMLTITTLNQFDILTKPWNVGVEED